MEKIVKKVSQQKNSKLLIIILSVALVIAVITGGYFYYRYHQSSKDPQAQIEARNSAETEEVLNSLQKILVINVEEQPTVAKVEDIEKLKQSNEAFYKDAAEGDYLVLYPDRAIIYRKDENKIINIAPIVDVNSSSKNEQDSQKKNN